MYEKYLLQLEEAGKIRNLKERSIDCYKNYVSYFLNYMEKVPEELTCQDVRDFLLAKKDDGLKATTLNLYNSAIRFFYRNVLHILWDDITVPRMMIDHKLPVILSVDEIDKLLDATDDLTCRWKYSVVEEKRPGEYLPVYENERGTYIFNSKDLCMIEHIPDLIDAGIDSYKIEGRMKTALYVATVARTYRKAIDDYLESPEKYEANMPWYLEQIKSCTYRQFTTGFFYGKPSEETQIYDNNTYEKGFTYLGIVGAPNEKGLYRMEQRNKFSVGEQIEIMKPNGDNVLATVLALVDEDGNEMESCPHPQQVFYVKLSETPDEFDILRRQENEAIALD